MITRWQHSAVLIRHRVARMAVGDRPWRQRFGSLSFATGLRTRQRSTVGPVRRWSAVVGVVAQVLVTVFLYLPAGLLVPADAWVVLNLAGVGLTVTAVAGARRQRRWVPVVPVVSVVGWVVFVTLGGALFGWQA